MKTCSKCKKSKELDEFSRDARAADKKQSQCKACLRAYAKQKEKEKQDYFSFII